MSKFLLNEEEKNNIRFMYESYGIILNEDSIWGQMAKKALSWAGKNEDDIINLFKTTEAALAKSIDDMVGAAAKSKNLSQLDTLQKQLMHYYNPSGQAAGIEAAKKNTVKFLNAYSKSKGKSNWAVIRNEASGVSQPSSSATASAASKASANMMSGQRVSERWYAWKPEHIDFTKFSNQTTFEQLNKNIAKAIKNNEWNLIPRAGFEKFGITNFREFLQNNISKVNEVIPETGRWSVTFK